jgi:RNA polymerase sigma factor (sigma-70 family)
VRSPSPAPDQNIEPVSTHWFTEQVHVHESALKTYLRSAFPAMKHEVDDVVQESYLRAWRSRSQRPLALTRAFLFRIARNVTLDLLRRRQVSPIHAVGDLRALPVMEDTCGVAESVSMNEKVLLLAQSLGTLPARAREVVVLRKFKGLSQKEVAAQLGISEKTVDEHLYRGLRRLGKCLRVRGVCSYYDR